MWLGNLADIPQLRLRTYDQHKIGWIQPNQLLRSLGTMLTIKGDSKPFWDKKLSAIHSRLLNWKRLFPSMLGKNFISKLSLFSCIWYYTQRMCVPKTFKDSLNNMINFFFHGGDGGDGLSSQGVPSEPSKLGSQCFLSQRHCVLGVTPQWVLSSANYRPQWVPYRLLQPHTLVALPWGQVTQVGEGQHVSLDQPPFCTLPSIAAHRQVGGL